MKILTQEWLKAARDDILTIEELLDNEHLTHIMAFHAEQAVEKCLKAILEEDRVEFPRIHDLSRLYKLVQGSRHFSIEQQDILQKLNTLYIDSRYPGEFGLLPDGKPSLEDAKEFYQFAQDIHASVSAMLSRVQENLAEE
ncbi:HEPN domain-containing protein [candidate division KSB3 bacterium]|uniref:HEPN domain-containing protein n=1 Tax=candidate division KSB3 bacterium TaxID=2044937 RepID=A0A9D5JZD6_9BACT|nr:HEPN domain-containing protein [candidate division KSB3 bacterium]MBD3326965.1 HEPN domain-containing protein [candidate division KSB3 bacterium]